MGITLMIIGVLIFVGGIVLYSSKSKGNAHIDKAAELEKVVEMAIADGVLTDRERELIKKAASDGGRDYQEIMEDVEDQLSKSDIEAETEIIDQKKKSGDDFEKFVVQKFNRKYFNVKEWAGDKYINGVFADTTPQPDILLELKLDQETAELSVECKWRKNLYKGGVEFASLNQLKRYKDFENSRKIPVFVAIGIGGKASAPESLFIVPLQKVDSNFIKLEKLKPYEKNIEKNFFYDIKTKELK